MHSKNAKLLICSLLKLTSFIAVTVQATFEKLENELKEVNTNAEALKRTYLELTELKHILRKTQAFFDEVCCFPGMISQHLVFW